MYNITLEWTEGTSKQRQEISLNKIVDIGRHFRTEITINDRSVARRQAIIYADQNGVYVQCINQKMGVGLNCGHTLQKGESASLEKGSQFCCGTVSVRVTELSQQQVSKNINIFPRVTRAYVSYRSGAV